MKIILFFLITIASFGSFAASVNVPEFTVRIEDSEGIDLILTEECHKIGTSTFRLGATVFNKQSIVTGSNGEYMIPAKKLKCSSITGVRIFFSIYTSTGKFIHRESQEGYDDVTVSSESLEQRFENPINLNDR